MSTSCQNASQLQIQSSQPGIHQQMASLMRPHQSLTLRQEVISSRQILRNVAAGGRRRTCHGHGETASDGVAAIERRLRPELTSETRKLTDPGGSGHTAAPGISEEPSETAATVGAPSIDAGVTWASTAFVGVPSVVAVIVAAIMVITLVSVQYAQEALSGFCDVPFVFVSRRRLTLTRRVQSLVGRSQQRRRRAGSMSEALSEALSDVISDADGGGQEVDGCRWTSPATDWRRGC